MIRRSTGKDHAELEMKLLPLHRGAAHLTAGNRENLRRHRHVDAGRDVHAPSLQVQFAIVQFDSNDEKRALQFGCVEYFVVGRECSFERHRRRFDAQGRAEGSASARRLHRGNLLDGKREWSGHLVDERHRSRPLAHDRILHICFVEPIFGFRRFRDASGERHTCAHTHEESNDVTRERHDAPLLLILVYGIHAKASSMSRFCSNVWLAFEPVAGLALALRATTDNGSRFAMNCGSVELM